MNRSKWFILKNIATFNGKPLSCITSTNKCFVKYNVLDFNFELSADLFWFSYSWRRRDMEEISCLGATKSTILSLEEILDIPYFRKLNTSDGKKIEEEINKNEDIKEAMIEKYGKKLGNQVYDQIPNRNSYLLCDRYCGYENILNKLKEDFKDDDFSKLNDISGCIIHSY